MSGLILRQKCPMCDEILDYDVISHAKGKDDNGNAKFILSVQTTPASTAHVWTHKPKD